MNLWRLIGHLRDALLWGAALALAIVVLTMGLLHVLGGGS